MKWKIYAWFMGIAFVAICYSDYGILKQDDIELTRRIISLGLVVGTFCFVYKRAILNQAFWKIVFIIAAIDELWGIVEFKLESDLDIFFFIGFVIGYGVLIPSFIAVYRYAYKPSVIWDVKIE